MSARRQFRRLLERPGMVAAPGAYDALSARIIEAQGFELVMAGGYAAIGSMLAEPDGGQSNVRDYADHYARICAAVACPVYVDADTGFGGVGNVRQMVRAFEAAGVAGLFISDQVVPNRCGYMDGKRVVSHQEMLERLKAALDARRDEQMVIVARSDALGLEGLDATIERCALYRELGADGIQVAGSDRTEDFSALVRAVSGPHVATMSNANPNPMPPPAAFEAAGAAMMIFPSAALFAAAAAVTRTMAGLHAGGTLETLRPEFMPLRDYEVLVGLPAQSGIEAGYTQAALAVLGARKT